MNHRIENDTLFIELQGRVDTTNAGEVETGIASIRAANPGKNVVLDCEDLQYISSAGLRVILRLRKSDPKLRLVGVSSEVYEILEMTGFTEMLPVEKAYRHISIDGCEVIGRGANGEVYRIDPETIVKVYLNPDSLDDIKHERDVARRALILGVPTAISYDVVKVGESYASMFELLNADSLSKLLKKHPENIDEYIRHYVALLKTIHGTEVPRGDLPVQKKTALKWTHRLENEIPAEQYEKLLGLMEAIPENDHMLHGDYHTKNIMMQDGEAILIDMDTLAVGDPVFEFAAMYLGYMGFSALDHTIMENFLGITWDQGQRIWNESLRLYLGTDDEKILRAQEDKAKLVCFTRLLRWMLEKNPTNTPMIEFAASGIEELLGRVDSLAW